jgi:hypothetical protein
MLARASNNIKQEVNCESVASFQGREHGISGLFIIISRYLATISEDVTE